MFSCSDHSSNLSFLTLYFSIFLSLLIVTFSLRENRLIIQGHMENNYHLSCRKRKLRIWPNHWFIHEIFMKWMARMLYDEWASHPEVKHLESWLAHFCSLYHIHGKRRGHWRTLPHWPAPWHQPDASVKKSILHRETPWFTQYWIIRLSPSTPSNRQLI